MATVSVEVKKSQHRYVIGPKGNSINEILSETGVYVEMPSSDSPSETITLRGPQEKLGLGKAGYLAAVSVLDIFVSVLQSLHRLLSDQLAEYVKEISHLYAVHMHSRPIQLGFSGLFPGFFLQLKADLALQVNRF